MVTDRLHGMIFALLAKTPCLVLENKSYKIRGVYDWIKDAGHIKLTNNEKLLEDYHELVDADKLNTDKPDLTEKFLPLADLIKRSIH